MPIAVPTKEAGLTTGLSGEIVLGTGVSVPPGLESIIEYRGNYLNLREWADTYIITEIGGLDDADVRDSRESNPGYHGETPFGSYYGGRTITLTGKIRAHNLSKLRDMQQGLRHMFSDISTEYPLIFHAPNPAYSVMTFCKKNQAIQMRETQPDTRLNRDFLITLRAANPRVLSVNTSLSQWVGITNNQSVSVINAGNFPAQPQLQITGPVNTGFAATFYNSANVQIGKILLTAAIPGGNTWYFDIAKRTIVDQAGVNKFTSLDVNSVWPELASGTNNIVFTGGGFTGASAFVITWRNTWI